MEHYRGIALDAVRAALGTLDPGADAAGLSVATPPDPSLGDLAVPCFPLAKALRRPPARIAADLAAAVELPADFRRVEAAGAYLNFFIDPGTLIAGASIVATLADALRALVSEGLAVLLVEQNRDFAARVADRAVTMARGRLAAAD